MGAAGDWEGKEGILWGMPGESRGTLRAAPCACVELISSPPTPPLLTPSLLSSLPLSRSRVLAAPEESTDSLGTWPRCLFALTYPLLFTATSLVLSLSLPPSIFPSPSPSSLSLPLYLFVSFLLFSRVFSLYFFCISQFLLSLRGSLPFSFYVVASYVFPMPAPTNKTNSLFLFPHPHPIHSLPYLSSSRFISLSGWSLFSLHPLYPI